MADTGPNRRALLALDRDDADQVSNPRELHDFGASRGIDGITVTTDGRIVGMAGTGAQGDVYVFAPSGRPLAFIPLPETPTNVEFGGPDRSTLSITASKSLYRIATTMTGHHLWTPAERQPRPSPNHRGRPSASSGYSLRVPATLTPLPEMRWWRKAQS